MTNETKRFIYGLLDEVLEVPHKQYTWMLQCPELRLAVRQAGGEVLRLYALSVGYAELDLYTASREALDGLRTQVSDSQGGEE